MMRKVFAEAAPELGVAFEWSLVVVEPPHPAITPPAPRTAATTAILRMTTTLRAAHEAIVTGRLYAR
jgi:hypothetical protein